MLLSDRLRLFYCDQHDFPLPPGHKFPLTKYRRLRERLSADERFELHSAELATVEDLLRVHTPEYVYAFLAGTLETTLMRRIGFPWSPELVTRTLASTGGTRSAVARALEDGFSGTLAGGTHHAYRSEGSGFCVFNDLAVAIEWARAERGLTRFAIVDLDVHQGDGTAAIFAGDPEVFTLSLHGERNFPFRKQQSVLDVPLPDGITDEDYLEALSRALPSVWAFGPQLVLVQSGVDGLETDRLGRLKLTMQGLHQRDRMVLDSVRQRGIPVAVTIGGGYSEPIERTVEANAQTFFYAADLYCGVRPNSVPAP